MSDIWVGLPRRLFAPVDSVHLALLGKTPNLNGLHPQKLILKPHKTHSMWILTALDRRVAGQFSLPYEATRGTLVQDGEMGTTGP